MRVKVKYFTTLRELAESAEEEIEIEDGGTLGDLIEEVTSKFGKKARNLLRLYHKEVDPSIYFLINGANARTLYGVNTKLKDGDIVAIIPPIGGG